MPGFDVHQIANLVGQLGGNHQQAAQTLSNSGSQQIDPSDPQHADMLQQLGVDPQQLQNGGYQQHIDSQNQPGFQGYQPGQDLSQQSAQFGQGGQQGGADQYGQQGGDQYGQQGGDQYGQQGGDQYGDQGQQQNY